MTVNKDLIFGRIMTVLKEFTVDAKHPTSGTDVVMSPFDAESLVESMGVDLSASRNLNYEEDQYTNIEAIAKAISNEVENLITNEMVLADISNISETTPTIGDTLVYNGVTWAPSSNNTGVPDVTGSKGGNVALESLINALSSLGVITDSTT